MRLPTAYQALFDAGVIRVYSPDVRPADNAPDGTPWFVHGPLELVLTDLEWLSPGQIADWDYGYGRRRELIPFATNGRVDVYAWYPPWAEEPAPPDAWPVVFSPRESAEATWFAPDTGGFLYRILLYELSGSWLVDEIGPGAMRPFLARLIDGVTPHLPPGAAEELRNLSAQPDVGDSDGFDARFTARRDEWP